MKDKSVEEIQFLIEQLRGRIEDLFPSNKKFDNDFFLYLWLLRHSMKVEHTENMIRKSIEWRKTVNAEELAQGEWGYFAPELAKEIPMRLEGITKKGQPVSSTIAAGLDYKILVPKFGRDNIIRYFTQVYCKYEHILLEHYKYGPTTDADSCGTKITNEIQNFKPKYNPSWDTAAITHICSFKDFCAWNMTSLEGLQIFVEGAKIGMNYFPANVRNIYFVDMNTFAALLVKMLKPIINSDWLHIEVFDTNKAKWSKALLKHIDPEQMQTYLGGTKVVKE